MIELPESLQQHLSGGATTLCYVWIVERADGIRLGFTDHDRPINIDNVDCEPATGFTAGAIESSLGLNGDSSQIDGALSSDAIDEKDIVAGRYDGARIFLYLVNWNDPSSYGLLRRYNMGEITREDGAFHVELRSFSSLFDQVQGRRFLRNCDAVLGDERCGINLDQNKYSITAAVVSDPLFSLQSIVFSPLRDFPGGWFTGGRLSWLNGDLAGKSFEIAHVRHQEPTDLSIVSLVQPLPQTAAVGDLFRLSAGCDKSFATCKAKFSNRLNFRGFPHMPGNDAALTYVDNETQFNGDPIVP